MFSEAVVRRVDEGLGLLLELPAEAPATTPLTPGYAHISNLGEDKVEDIGKVRVEGMQGSIDLCLAVKGQGRLRTAVIIGCWTGKRLPRGQCNQALRCGLLWQHHADPLLHQPSETPNVRDVTPTPVQRFRPGQKLRARVLGFRPMDGLAVLSLKPSVVDSHILSIAGEGQLLLLLLLLLL